MEISTIIGIVAGFFFICISILFNGELGSFLNWPSVLIVFGGTFAATVVAYPSTILRSLVDVYKNAFKKKDIDLHKDINLIISIANIARKEGLLALENSIEEMEDPFLKKGIMLIVDGADTELVKSVLNTEVYFIQERHTQGQAVINSMATYAPAFGMAGTLIGLINMLKDLSDYDALGPGMATALVTTFYGVLLANLVFSPIAKKLKVQSDKEILQKELFIEGLLSVQEGENSRIIKDKLTSFVSQREIIRLESAKEKETNPEVKEIQDEGP